MDPLVSVIMSTYNEKLEWLELSIQSILSQTYQNIEFVIVLDNPDNLAAMNLLTEYGTLDERIVLLINEKNIGLAKSLNRALDICNGVYVARMDADDISDATRLEMQLKYLEEHDLDFVFSGMVIMDETEKELYATHNKGLKNEKLKKMLLNANISNHPTWFLKKEIYDKLDGYREVPYCEDYDFTLRALSRGYKIGEMTEKLVRYRKRFAGISLSNGLQQFLNSRGLVSLNKKTGLEEWSRIELLLKKTFDKSGLPEARKFVAADKKLNFGIRKFKEKEKLIGCIAILSCLAISKFSALRFYDFLKYKISLARLKAD